MSEEPYRAEVWSKTGGIEILIALQPDQKQRLSLFHFSEPSKAIGLFENLIEQIKNTVAIEDMSAPGEKEIDELVDEIKRQLQPFCRGEEMLVRMKKDNTYKKTVSYGDCGNIDIPLGKSERRTNRIHFNKTLFKGEPPEYLSIRITESKPAGTKSGFVKP